MESTKITILHVLSLMGACLGASIGATLAFPHGTLAAIGGGIAGSCLGALPASLLQHLGRRYLLREIQKSSNQQLHQILSGALVKRMTARNRSGTISRMDDSIIPYAVPSFGERHFRRAAIVLFVWAGIAILIGPIITGCAVYALFMLLFSAIDPVGLDLAATSPFIIGGVVLVVFGINAIRTGRHVQRGQPSSIFRFVILTVVAECITLAILAFVVTNSVLGIWVWDSPRDNALTAIVLCGSFLALACALIFTHIALGRARRVLNSQSTAAV